MRRENCKAIKYLALFLVFLSSCKKDKPNPSSQAPNVDPTTQNVYIVCEGSLGNGNSLLSLYRPEEDTVYTDVYGAVNNAEQLGDVFQSMTLIGDNYFLCINNSDKIVVIRSDNWEYVGTINNILKPRYVVEVSPTKAYVSSLFSNNITIINPQTLQITGSIHMPGMNPEGMLMHNNEVLVALWDTAVNQLYKINPGTDHVSPVQYLHGRAPKEIIEDKLGHLWVLSGNIQQGRNATLTRINGETFQKMGGMNFPANADPMRLAINPDGDKLYFLGVNYSGQQTYNGVFTMSIADTSLPVQPLIPAQSLQYFWALGVDPHSGNIYVGDPRGFTQQGVVTIFTPDGNFKNNFFSGVGPGHFVFE